MFYYMETYQSNIFTSQSLKETNVPSSCFFGCLSVALHLTGVSVSAGSRRRHLHRPCLPSPECRSGNARPWRSLYRTDDRTLTLFDRKRSLDVYCTNVCTSRRSALTCPMSFDAFG